MKIMGRLQNIRHFLLHLIRRRNQQQVSAHSPDQPEVTLEEIVRFINDPAMRQSINTISDDQLVALALLPPGTSVAEFRTSISDTRAFTDLVCNSYFQRSGAQLVAFGKEQYERVGRGMMVIDLRPNRGPVGGYLSYEDAQSQLGQFSLSFAKELRAYDPQREVVILVIWHNGHIAQDEEGVYIVHPSSQNPE